MTIINVFEFDANAARILAGGEPSLDAAKILIGYHVSSPHSAGSIVRTLAAARTRERGYDRSARQCYGSGAGFDAKISPVYSDGSSSGPWAYLAIAWISNQSKATLRRWQIVVEA